MCTHNRNRLTDIENKCGYQCGEGTGEGWDGGMGLRDTNCYVSNSKITWMQKNESYSDWKSYRFCK